MLVERGVHHTEFSEFEIFEPEQHGALSVYSSYLCCSTASCATQIEFAITPC